MKSSINFDHQKSEKSGAVCTVKSLESKNLALYLARLEFKKVGRNWSGASGGRAGEWSFLCQDMAD